MKKIIKKITTTLITTLAIIGALCLFSIPAQLGNWSPVNKAHATELTTTEATAETTSTPTIFNKFTKPGEMLTIDPIESHDSRTSVTEIIERNGTISEQNDFEEYSFVPQNSGLCFFWLENVTNNARLSFEILDSDHKQLCYLESMGAEDGYYLELTAESVYTIRIMHHEGTGAYTLKGGFAKATLDISDLTSVSDDIGFFMQQNTYTITPTTTGTHCFELSDMADDTSFALSLYDETGKLIDEADDASLAAILEADKQYLLHVVQQEGVGKYTLNVYAQKPVTEISDYTSVSDCLQFAGQTNIYQVTPKEPINYYIDFSEISNEAELVVTLYDNKNVEIGTRYFASVDDQGYIECPEGNVFYLIVSSSETDSSYVLNLRESVA